MEESWTLVKGASDTNCLDIIVQLPCKLVSSPAHFRPPFYGAGSGLVSLVEMLGTARRPGIWSIR